MKLTTEITEEKQKILIVSKKNYPFITLLKTHLRKYQGDIFFSPQIPKSLKSFDYCFFINEEVEISKFNKTSVKQIVLIFFNQKNLSKKYLSKHLDKIKIIEVTGDIIREDDVEKILWFSLSQTNETHLKLSLPEIQKIKTDSHQKYWQKLQFFFSPKRLIIAFISLIVIIHFLFIPPLITSFVFIYRAFFALKNEDYKTTFTSLTVSTSLLNVSKKIYLFVRPTYLLFSLALIPDNLFDVSERIQNIITNANQINSNTKEIQKLIFQKNKTAQEKSSLNLRIIKLKNDLNHIEEDLQVINQKIPLRSIFFQNTKTQLVEVIDGISKLKKFFEHLDTIFAKEKESKYLILFANNMELRPGGGFLGSFGIVYIKDYTIEDIKIYDVYDADGQLKAHIEPPEPIKRYLNLPHWFLRDSNFSPDFLENYLKAQFFLEKEMKMTEFAGGILITASAIEQILSAFGNIYLPDFNEYINHRNFYLKAQIYSEKGFFPGSIQKKSFLSALTRQIIINLDNVSFRKLTAAVKKSLDEKQIVVYFEDPKLQKLIDSWYWSGQLIEPKCPPQVKSCIIDYLFPYDANLGVNKANFFINRSFTLKTNIDSKGLIHHLLSIQYKNESPSEVFPGGTYRNFFQVLLPKDISLKKITKDGIIVEEFTEKIDQFKNIGFFFEVPPKKTVEIKIDYQLAQTLQKGSQLYQLIIQKQIGSFNNDLALEFNLAKNTYLINQNFSPLVKEGSIIYNTNLTTDKIFFVEIVKE